MEDQFTYGFPLSPQQRRLWSLQQADHGAAYRAQCTVMIEGNLQPDLLKSAIQLLIGRHEILRTTFRGGTGFETPLQFIMSRDAAENLRIARWLDPDCETEVDHLLAEIVSLPFDLQTPPLIHVSLARLSSSKHALIIGLPSLCADRRTLDLIVRKLAEAYARLSRGEDWPVDSLQYVDVADWENDLLTSVDTETGRQYWIDQELPEPLIPGFGRYGANPKLEFKPKHLSIAVEASLSLKLGEIVTRYQTSEFALMLACWQALLFRFTGRADFTIGVAYDGRRSPELEDVIGPLERFLPIKCLLKRDESFASLMRQVGCVSEEASRRQEYFTWEHLTASGRAGLNGDFFPACFEMTKQGGPYSAGDVTFSTHARLSSSERFDVKLSCIRNGSGLVTEFHHKASEQIDGEIMKLALQFHVLLRSAVNSPETPIGRLELLSEAERSRIVVGFNDTKVAYPRDKCLHELIEKQVELTPEKEAVVFDRHRLTYTELNARANYLAGQLADLRVGPDVLVGVRMERSLEMVVAMLGILKAGGAYVPIDPDYPGERAAFILEDTNTPVLLTQEHLLAKQPDHRGQTLCLSSNVGELSAGIQTNPRSRVTADNAAYVIYTSGSTGRPKGVVIDHRGITNRLLWMQDQYRLTETDRILQKTPYSFDVSVWEFFWPLLTGATLVLALPKRHKDGLYLVDMIKEQQITTLHFVPSMLRAFLDVYEIEKCMGLKQVICSGEALGLELQQLFFSRTNARLHNLYGPTEASVDVTYWECDRQNSHGVVPLGHPIANTQIHILDDYQQVLPIGVTGELYIGGVGLARGYLNRADLTAEKFIPNPFSRRPGERLYRTGDLGRYLADSSIEYLGRIDDQVKIRGYRIELGEIESTLALHPSVKDCAVVVERDAADLNGSGVKRLVAFFVGDGGERLSPERLRSYLALKLPDYMIPSTYIEVQEFPVTANGKLDRNALASQAGRRHSARRAYVAPRNPIEQTLTELWAQALRVEKVSVLDNFFELGGDSIISIRIVAKANRAGIKLSPMQMFEHQTIAELARVAGTAHLVEVDQQVVQGWVQLTPIQQWFFEQEVGKRSHFNQAVLLEMREQKDAGKLFSVIKAIMNHHDALRMSYQHEGGEWKQFNHGSLSRVPYHIADLSAVGARQQRTAIENAAEMMQRSLKLETGEVFRVGDFRLGEAKARLLIVAHHLVMDGVSWRILLEDIATGYQQVNTGAAIEFGPKTTSYQEWAHKLTEYAMTEELSQETVKWGKQLAKATGRIPLDKEGENKEESARSISVWLGDEQTREMLEGVPRAYGTRVNEVLMTGLILALRAWSGNSSIAIDVEGHGREEVAGGLDLSRTVGWFTSLYPIVLDIAEQTEVGEVIKTVKEQVRDAARTGINFGVAKYSGGAKELRKCAERQVVFNYLGRIDQAEGGGLVFAKESSGRPRDPHWLRPYVLDVSGFLAGGRLQLTITYSNQLHEEETIRRLLGSYKQELERVIEHCRGGEVKGYTVSDFPEAKISQKELEELNRKVGKIEAIYPLSPMQQGILYHSLLASESMTYFGQMSCRLEGGVDVAALKRAWQMVVDRHSILRTGFEWKHTREVMQVVRPQVGLRWEEQDWSEEQAGVQRRRLERYLQAEKSRGLSLSEAPVMRIALMKLGDDAYELVWNYHHLLMDGWSTSLLIKELFELYESFKRGEGVEVKRGRPFRDYIVWLGRQDLSKAEDFWREELKGFKSPTRLVVERAKSREGQENRQREKIYLSEEEADRVREMGKRKHLTVNTILQGGWAVILSRYSGQQDVVYGATVSGRPADLEGIEEMIGLFINTMAVRMKVKGDDQVIGWLEQVQRKQVELREYEYSPLMMVQAWSEIERGEALFDSLLVFENYPVDDTLNNQSGSLQIRDVKLSEDTNYGLTLLIAQGRRIPISISYDGNRYEAETIRLILERFKRVLLDLADNPHNPVGEISLLSDDERQQVLREWNKTGSGYDTGTNLVDLFREQVRLNGARVAVRAAEATISYEELNRRANQLARYLRNRGARAEQIVAVMMERSVEMVVGLMGVLKSGAAYLPLDPSYPTDRLRYMLDDSDAVLVLTQASLLSSISDHQATVVCIDRHWEEISTEDDADLPVETFPENPAYVIYTSGSTGRSKGAVISHRAIVNHMKWMQEEFPLEHSDKVLQKTPFSFDASVWEFHAPLLSGAELVMARPGGHQDTSYLVEAIGQQEITVLQVVPTMLQALLQEREISECRSLRRVFSGGEALSVELQRRFEEVLSASLHNLYGPTEAAIDSTFWTCIRGDYDKNVPIGRPISNMKTYILDEVFQPVPPELPGELYISGPGLGRGYLGRPEMTAEKFLPDPFAEEPDERMYRTGDMARYLRDGSIEFLGRADAQVKVRGYRIELEEVEWILNQHPAVKQSAVLAREVNSGDKRLIAYFVLAEQGEATPIDLKSYLSGRLPQYMIPSAFLSLESISTLPNGKLDRRALLKIDAELDGELYKDESRYLPPRTPAEETVAAILSEVLGIERVGLEDEFFELGGNSLLAMKVINRLRGALDVELQLRELFAAPTVAGLAARVEQMKENDPRSPAVPLVRVARDTDLPLSFAQRRIWFIDQLTPGTSLYNVPFAIRLTGPLKIAILKNCFEEIIRRHELLRSSFVTQDGKPVQMVLMGISTELPVVDMSEIGIERKEIEAQKATAAEMQRPFDLTRPPLIRLTLLRLEENDYVLLLTMHHIVTDAWSTGILIREVVKLYQAFSENKPSPLPDLPIQYADFACWQHSISEGEAFETELAYWKQQLKDSPPVLRLPADRPRQAVQSGRGGSERLLLSEGSSKSLAALALRVNATLFMTLLAAFQVLLSRYSGQDDIVVGTPVSGRNRIEVEGLLGVFLNTLVLRADLSGRPTFSELLSRVREVVLNAYTHQELPFERLVEELDPDRSLSHTPIFQVMFVLQNTPRESLQIPGLNISILGKQAASSEFDLTLSMAQTQERVIGELEYNADIFDASTITRMAGHLTSLLEAIAAHPDQPIGQLTLLRDEEREQILREWNKTGSDNNAGTSLVEFFQEQAYLNGASAAVKAGEEEISYQELNRRANQLARYLISRGARAEQIVAVMMERSIDMVVGLMGVLKSGAAYLPLDPSYPTDRLRYMLNDCAVTLTLTQKHLLDFVPEHQASVIAIDEDWALIANQPDDNIRYAGHGENLAYIVYTSGSTGSPKGVLIRNRGLLNHSTDISTRYRLGRKDRVLQFAAVSFDVAAEEIFPALLSGASILFRPDDVIYSTRAFTEFVEAQQVSVVNLPTSYWYEWLTELDNRGLGVPACVRLVIIGSERVLAERFNAWSRLAGNDAAIFNAYGASETTITSTTYQRGGALQPLQTFTLPIGKPIANTEAYIVDSYFQPVPICVTGELYIGGDGLARGYLARPDLTAQAFIPNPFSDERGGRIYKTGDLARYLPDGNIEFVGRTDHQFKIRGFRIERGEIESALVTIEGVREAVVIDQLTGWGAARLVAYLTAEDEQELKIGELRNALKRTLPDYMIPSAFVILDQMPLSASGKIDTTALRALETVSLDSDAPFVSPRTSIEQEIAEMWRELLGIDRISVHDNFFDLGGHSLLLTQLASRVRSVFQVELPVRVLFESPTILQITEAILDRQVSQLGEGTFDEMLNRLKQMTPEEMKAVLEANS